MKYINYCGGDCVSNLYYCRATSYGTDTPMYRNRRDTYYYDHEPTFNDGSIGSRLTL